MGALPYNNNAEGGTNGTGVTTGNSGGGSGTAFDQVQTFSGSTCVYSSAQAAHGSLSVKVKTVSNSASAYVTWNSFTAQATLYGRCYYYFTGNVPSGGTRIVEFFKDFDTGTYIGGIGMISGAPTIAIQNAAFTFTKTWTTAMTLNTWYRIEYKFTFGNSGSATVNLYQGDSSTILEGYTVTGQNFGSSGSTGQVVNYGWAFNASNQPDLYLDDMNVNSTGFPGPAAPAGPNATGGITLAPLAFSGTGNNANAISGGFAIAPGSGLRFSGQAGPLVPVTTSGGMTLAPVGFAGSTIENFPFPLFILGVMLEILVNGVWTDISSYLYVRNTVVIQRGRVNWASGIQSSQMTLTLNNRDGRFSPLNSTGPYFPYIQRNVQMRLSIVNSSSSQGVLYTGYRFNGEVAVWPPTSDVTGTDVYVQLTAWGIFKRYLQGKKVGSPISRYYKAQIKQGTTFAPIAMWPGEDSTSSVSVASAISGGQAMTFTGTPSFMSDSSFLGSDPIPIVTGSTWHGQTGASANPPGTGSINQITPGTYTITAPPGVTTMNVVGVGAGGAGGDTDGTKGGSGAGGGEYVSAAINVTPGNTYTYTVPAGGQVASGGNGGNGGDFVFTGDSQTLTAHGGKGGGYAGAAGGAGGTGSALGTHHNGGAGAAGTNSTTASFTKTLNGSPGATGGGNNNTAAQTTATWVAPPNVVTNPTVIAVGSGGGGGGGDGSASEGGGVGGGGGAYATGTITVHAGGSYIIRAGNGGRGGTGGAGTLSENVTT